MGMIVVIGGGIFVAFRHDERERKNLGEESSIQQVGESELVESSESTMPEPDPEQEPPSRDISIPFADGEESFIQNVHDMTHQKVYAEDESGAIEASVQNINALLAILDETDFADKEYYREVLIMWKDGDFSNAVEVHNKIWKDQGGHSGKAERLLTPEEEKEFVENNFR